MALFHFLVLSLCITCCIVDARSKTLLNEQNYFTTSNSTMRQVDNDFDCVDIYKQPALQHPLLKNHKIQLYPTFAKNVVHSRPSYDGGCPAGKVPIYKKIRNHQIVTNYSSKLQFDYADHSYKTLFLSSSKDSVNGGYALISIYNISVELGQSSSALVCVANGPENEVNAICAGINVQPGLYGDSQPRLTTQWMNKVDGGDKGCLNKQCPGFVQVLQNKPYIGDVLSPSTPIGEKKRKFVVGVRIQRDTSTGHWWLIINTAAGVGYWPKELFSHLNEGAAWVRFVGEVSAAPNLPYPPMGSGRLPNEGYNNAAMIGKLMTIDSNSVVTDVLPEDMESYNDANTNCYDLLYYKYSGRRYRQAFLFGGPGGQNC